MGFAVFFGLLLVGGALCGYIAMLRINSLTRELGQLRKELRKSQRGDVTSPSQPIPTQSQSSSTRRQVSTPENAFATKQPAADDASIDPTDTHSEASLGHSTASAGYQQSSSTSGRAAHVVAAPHALLSAFKQAQQNWMIWLGASCVTLAGIFLVRYSIETGLLGPTARIALALVFGVACHGFAEWTRRRSGWTFAAIAALAGAGSIIIYAAILAALRLYDLISPGVAFIALALVATATMTMARIHGPLLAAFGILGAFAVPVLVSTGSGNITVLLIYAATISVSALLLLRYVYRPWLWWGFALGALFWGLVAAATPGNGAGVSLYFAFLAYAMSALPEFDWSLSKDVTMSEPGYHPKLLFSVSDPQDRFRLVLYALFAVAIFFAVLGDADAANPWLIATPFLIVSLLLARRQDHLYWLPWMSLLGVSAAWLLALASWDADASSTATIAMEHRATFLGYLLLLAGIASGLSLWSLGVSRRPAVFASMATLAPALLLALAYLLVARPDVEWNWGLATIMFGLVYLAIAAAALRKLTVDSLIIWLFVGGHFLLALAAAMLLREASLTLAIAAQLLSLAWVIQRFEQPGLGWLLKVIVAVVIARLTFNPWLPDYPTDVHWSLWTYGGSTLFAAVAAYVLKPREQLSAWVGAAALHLAVLTLWSELRYQLYDGAVYHADYAFTEAVFSMLLLGTLGLVYRFRMRFSQHLKRFVLIYSNVLFALSAAIYLRILLNTLESSAWVYTAISARPIANLGTLAFAGPVVVLIAIALLVESKYRRIFMALAGVSGWIFVSLQIRHLWAGTVRLDSPEIANGELYTYSVVWLAIAIVAVLAGAWRLGQDVYRAGMLLLALVIAKLFFWDMSGLEGLLRVASFMGLGLSLLGLSFLHQRLSKAGDTES